MSKTNRNLKPEDEKKLRDLLKQNKELFEQLSARYLLKEELIEVTNRSYSATKIIEAEIDNLRTEINQTISEKNKLIQGMTELSNLNNQIEKFQNLLEQEYSDSNILLIDYLENILDQDKIDEIVELKQQIIDFHAEIYQDTEGHSPSSRINEFLLNMDKAQKFLTDTVEFNGIPVLKKDLIKKQYETISTYYNSLFDNSEENAIATDLDTKIYELNQFHQKIFGNEQKASLKDDLEKRLIELKRVEEEARKVINLASDAGLAGGFVEKARQAKYNKWGAVVILSLSLIIMFIYNKDIFNDLPIDKETINNASIILIILRLMMNAPLLWLAIVANINLNKYSRLEQDYAHKEALAKSYERYKTEISKLSEEDTEIEGLKYELIKINLEAFKFNPADNMDKAKSDTVLDKILAMKYLRQENTNETNQDINENASNA